MNSITRNPAFAQVRGGNTRMGGAPTKSQILQDAGVQVITTENLNNTSPYPGANMLFAQMRATSNGLVGPGGPPANTFNVFAVGAPDGSVLPGTTVPLVAADILQSSGNTGAVAAQTGGIPQIVSRFNSFARGRANLLMRILGVRVTVNNPAAVVAFDGSLNFLTRDPNNSQIVANTAIASGFSRLQNQANISEFDLTTMFAATGGFLLTEDSALTLQGFSTRASGAATDTDGRNVMMEFYFDWA